MVNDALMPVWVGRRESQGRLAGSIVIFIGCAVDTRQQALEWGSVNAVVPRSELDRTVREWCDELLGMSPTSLAVLKASFRETMEPYIRYTLADTIKKVNPGFFESGEQQEGVAALYEKRRPDFSRWR